MDKGFGHWLAGFIDGEGCFCITKRGDCLFTLVLAIEDYSVLELIKEQTGIGNLRIHHPPSHKRPFCIWRTDSRKDHQALIALLDQYPLRAKKRNDYLTWKDAVSQKRNDRQELRELLMEGRKK